VVAATVGPRPALLIDATSFALSALLIRTGVRKRPPADRRARPGRLVLAEGWRLVFASPVARTAMLLMWLAALYGGAPEGVAVPLGRTFGSPAYAGLLLAAMCAGAAVGPLAWTRLVAAEPRMRLTAMAALAACLVLVAFAASPPLGWALVILAVSGACTGYLASANGALFRAIPDEHRGKADGAVGAGMAFGQGVLVLAAGAAAQAISPPLVVAACGAAGTVAAIPLALAWRKTRGPYAADTRVCHLGGGGG
jgi:MFS family permease